jgi:hypothetical protein
LSLKEKQVISSGKEIELIYEIDDTPYSFKGRILESAKDLKIVFISGNDPKPIHLHAINSFAGEAVQ